MTKWTKASPSGVRWPEKWDEDEGWASSSCKEGTGLNREPRSWLTLFWCHIRIKAGVRPSSLVEDLGGPKGHDLNRTLDQTKKVILDFYKRTGQRPTRKTNKEWANANSWLNVNHGFSLAQLCSELGIPGIVLTRTLEGARNEILAYYNRIGKRPSRRLNQDWSNLNHWFRLRGTSISKECDLLNLPVSQDNRELRQCHAKLREYFAETGKRPSANTSLEFRQWNEWLRRIDTTLSEECNKLGFPVVYRKDRTIEQCHEEILAHYKETGKRPVQNSSKRFNNWKAWLSKRGLSLTKECDKLGLPASPGRWP